MITLSHYISESKSGTWLGCLMLSMPGDIATLIQAFGKSRIHEGQLADDGFETYSHCTVLYGFSQGTNVAEVESFLKGYDKIPIMLGNIKRFKANDNRPDSDVLVIDVEGLALRKLNADLKDNFDVVSTYPTYNPHVTIAYVKPGAYLNLDRSPIFNGIKCVCDKMTYSSGPSENRDITNMTFEQFRNEEKTKN